MGKRTNEASEGRKPEGKSPPRVLILGGGYGGVYTALALQKAARKHQIELSLVSRDNFFLFQPMLSEVVSGNIEPPHIVNPIRRMCRFTNFYQAEIEGVDTSGRNVIIRYPGHSDYHYIPYDHLVIAVGSITDLSALPGVNEHAFPFKTLGDALYLRNHIIGVLESAEVEEDPAEKRQLLTFVVAGGGYTGVEVAGEIHEFVREASKSYRHVEPEEVKVILLQGGKRILPELSQGLAAFSHRLLERRGIEIRLQTRIASATGQSASLNDGETVLTSTLVAAVGAAPNPLLEKLPCSRDSKGRVNVESTLAVPGYPGLWAVGDCAAVLSESGGTTYPPTAQVAMREARHVARNIMAEIRGGMSREFSYRSRGVFVPLGRFSAAAEVMGFKISGLRAWWLYRTYYLYQLPRIERKIKVLMDWNLAMIFRRDIVKQDISRSGGVSRVHYDAGQIIFRQGELYRSFYIIISGEVQVFREQNGREVDVATLGPGQFFGEIAILQGTRRTASIRAITAVDLLSMSGADFNALATSSTHFSELLTGVMQQRISENTASDRQ